jgi:hypothetical protein
VTTAPDYSGVVNKLKINIMKNSKQLTSTFQFKCDISQAEGTTQKHRDNLYKRIEKLINESQYFYCHSVGGNEESMDVPYKDEIVKINTALVVQQRLEYLRKEIRAERISYGEIAELQSLKEHVAEDDVELLAWITIEEL